MRKRIDYRRVGRQILIFLFILVLGLLNLKAQVVYSEDFSASPNGSNTSPKWEINANNAAPDMFWVTGHQFECKNLRGEAVWHSSLIDISGFNYVNASVSLEEKGQVDADDFIRVYYNVDGKGEVLFSGHGNNEGVFGTAQALQHNISGNDLQISIHVKNDQYNERYTFDNIRVEGRAETFTWLGTVDSVWSKTANWSSGSVPTFGDDVIISGSAEQQPIITATAECKSLTIEKSATLRMAGAATLSVYGNMLFAGKFFPATGTVSFTGNQAQAIENEEQLSFHNLEVKNGSAEGVRAKGKINVRNKLTLTDGLLVVNDTITLVNANPEALAAFSDSSFIAGKFQRRISDKGEGSYTFPVGMNGPDQCHDVRIDVNELGGTHALTVSFQEHERDILSGLNITNSEFNYEFYIPEGRWVITPDVEPVAGWYDIRLSVRNVSGLADNMFGIIKRPRGTDEKAWRADFGSESVFGGEGRKFSDGYALKKYCTGFSEFTLAGGGTAIPIELLDFNAELHNGKVNLDWSTATETENNYFTIEKSNGTDFREVAKVNSLGNSSTLQTYSAVDEKPFTGVSYYRLKQTDFDGKEEFSDVVAVSNAGDSQFILFPNPAEGSVKLKFTCSLPRFDVVVYNQSGIVCYTKTFINPGASSVVDLQLKDELPSGVYYVQVSAEKQDLMIQQIVIQ